MGGKMRPYEVMRHPPGGFGFWHVGWHDLFWLALPVLFVLPLLALLVALLWPARHALLGRLGNRPENAYYPPPVGQTAGATSAVELLRQRYARGEIDRDSYAAMRDELHVSTPDQPQRDGPPQQYRPRPDAPIDWS